MYKFSWLFAILVWSACGSQPSASEDSAAALAELKRQKSELDSKIAALEGQATDGAPMQRRIRTVGLEEVRPSLFQHFIDVQGRVDAEDNIMATPKMPGVLTAVLVKNGSYVQKGQVIATLDKSVMQRSMTELQTQITLAKDVYNRQKSLWDQKIGTEIQYIQAKTQVEALENSMATLNEQMSQSSITAPISGTVDNVILKAGQAISPGMPLCQIINMGNLKIIAQVPESYSPYVKQGAGVKIFFPDLKQELNSTVTYAAKTIDPVSRTFAVESKLPAGKEYRPNMVAVQRIIDYQNKAALVIPVNLIQTDESGQFVLVAEKKGEKQAMVRKKSIQQGKVYNGKAEILSGLSSGDMLIAVGWQEVNAGDEVAF